MVEKRALGRSGLQVSVIGCWSFGGGDYGGARIRAMPRRLCARLDRGVLLRYGRGYNAGAARSLGRLRGRRHEAVIAAR